MQESGVLILTVLFIIKVGKMQKVTGKPQILKKVNSSVIEQMIYEHGPLSKPELVKLTSLSLPTVGKLVDDLEKTSGFAGSAIREKAPVAPFVKARENKKKI
jgi:hypothetical protein